MCDIPGSSLFHSQERIRFHDSLDCEIPPPEISPLKIMFSDLLNFSQASNNSKKFEISIHSYI